MTDKLTPQIEKFKKAARELECDDDDQRFKDRIGKLAKAKLKPSPTPDSN